MATNSDFRVSLKFASVQLDNATFDEAANIIEGHIKAEHNACERLVKKINEDHWITSFWSEVLGGAKPPTYAEWINPISTLESARSAYRARNYLAAQTQLKNVFEQYKELHTKWMKYRNKIVVGGERAITVINWTITILSAVATAGGGSMVASTGLKGLAIKGAIAAGVKGGTTAATQVGSYVQMDDKIDVGKIAMDAGLGFVTSLIGGKLSDVFKGYMTPKIVDVLKTDQVWNQVWKEATHSATQKFVADFLGKIGPTIVGEAVKKAVQQAKGKSLTMGDFIKLVADQITKQTIKSAIKTYIESQK